MTTEMLLTTETKML